MDKESSKTSGKQREAILEARADLFLADKEFGPTGQSLRPYKIAGRYQQAFEDDMIPVGLNVPRKNVFMGWGL